MVMNYAGVRPPMQNMIASNQTAGINDANLARTTGGLKARMPQQAAQQAMPNMGKTLQGSGQDGIIGGLNDPNKKIGALTNAQGLAINYDGSIKNNNGFVNGVQQQQVPAVQQPQQQYGLSGAESALMQGAQGGINALGQGLNQGLDTLLYGNNLAQNQFQQGRDVLAGGTQAGLNQLQQGVKALGGNYSAAAAQANTNAGQGMFNRAAQGVDRFSGAGLQAQGVQSALSGAQGQEAFNQALLDSPMQALLRQRGQDALANQAAASGGLGSGQFQTELQELGQAQAQNQVQQQIANLNQLSGQGLQAAGQAGSFLSQGGQAQAQLAGQNAQLATQANLANAANRLSADRSQADLFNQGANLINQSAGQQANLFGQGGSLAGSLASQGAGYQVNAGNNLANLFTGTGQNIANNRFQTGTNLSNNIGQSTSALSNLANQQGSGLADIIGAGGSNLANLLSGAGQYDAGQQTQLAQLLANLSTGQGTQLSNIALGQGDANAQAALAQGQNATNLIGNLAGAYGQYAGGQ